MLIIRFKLKCKPGKSEQAMAALREVVTASRPLEGVVSFDVGWDVTDPDAFIATEVFRDHAAIARQESLPSVIRTVALLGEIAAAAPEATVFHVSSSEPHGGAREIGG